MKKINVLISTFFGYGYLTKIPGTVTSLVTTVFIYSFYAVKDVESEFKNKDPRQIVIDEVLGQAMPLILVLHLSQNNQLNILIEVYYVLSFIFFRFFDILKPFPVSYFDKNFKNYFGIIMDDIMAGLYSMILIYLISLKF